jgi:hypothetical protein
MHVIQIDGWGNLLTCVSMSTPFLVLNCLELPLPGPYALTDGAIHRRAIAIVLTRSDVDA